jgi:hypothetical protein
MSTHYIAIVRAGRIFWRSMYCRKCRMITGLYLSWSLVVTKNDLYSAIGLKTLRAG